MLKRKEQEVKIPIPNSKLYIYGTLRGSLNQSVVVFVHGLTGHRNEHIYYNGARFFEEYGYSSFRFNLYDGAKDARKLIDSTVKIHAEDLDTVTNYLTKIGAKEIFVVGHSYGGPTILSSKNKKFKAAVLWDPHHSPIRGFKKLGFEHIRSIHRWRVRWGSEVYVSEKMYIENAELNCDWLAASFNIPTKIIYAKKGILEKASHSYFKHLAGDKDIIDIENATHCFDEEGAEEQLLQETLKWFNKYKG